MACFMLRHKEYSNSLPVLPKTSQLGTLDANKPMKEAMKAQTLPHTRFSKSGWSGWLVFSQWWVFISKYL